jgi:YjjG family noncanonical pyrimidine nucleotidase
MKQYKHLLFDIDDTLFDFYAASTQALIDTSVAVMGFPFEENDTFLFHKINSQLWHLYSLGQLKQKNICDTRFSLMFSQLGLTFNSTVFEREFMKQLATQHPVFDDAIPVLEQLKPRYRLHAATNAIALMQRNKLEKSGRLPYCERIFISEDVGCSKPQKEFFVHILDKLGADPDEVLMIGDSLKSDIAGAATAGIDSCWVNRRKRLAPKDITPTYTVRTLPELTALLP